jgi:hypothetical protein
MKVVINKCYGGFGLSRVAIKRIAELQGRACYFFETNFETHKHVPARESSGLDIFWSAYDIPNPDEALPSQANWHELTPEQKKFSNEEWSKHTIDDMDDDRTNSLLIQVVEELGTAANGGCSKLSVVEIPDGTEYEIDEYDGMESIHEKHRTWG